MPTTSIPDRFCGPPGYGNGGYSCGAFAAAAGIDGPAAVSLRSPVPLERELGVEPAGDTGTFRVSGPGGELIAEVAEAAALDFEPPARPGIDAAGAAGATSPFLAPDREIYPGCFVCGPEHPSGLNLCVGRLEGAGGPDGPEIWADSFAFEPADAEPDGSVRPELVWSALDCPSCIPSFWSDRPTVLAHLEGELLASVPAGEGLVAVSWSLGSEGRKLRSAAAILGPGGEVLARARALWIRLREG